MPHYIYGADIVDDAPKFGWREVRPGDPVRLYKHAPESAFNVVIGSGLNKDNVTPVLMYEHASPSEINDPECVVVGARGDAGFSGNDRAWMLITDRSQIDGYIRNVSRPPDEKAVQVDIAFMLDGTMDCKKKTLSKRDEYTIIEWALLEKIKDPTPSEPNRLRELDLLKSIGIIKDITSGINYNSKFMCYFTGEYPLEVHPHNFIDIPESVYEIKPENPEFLTKADFEGFLDNIKLKEYLVDGGDYADCIEVGLQKASNLKWRENAAKFLVIFTDSVPHPHYPKDPENDDLNSRLYREFYCIDKSAINWEDEADAIRRKGIKILLVHRDLRNTSLDISLRDIVLEIWHRIGGRNLINLSNDREAVKREILGYITSAANSQRNVNVPKVRC